MNTNLIGDIKEHIRDKTTEDLLDIWVENDREKWSAEYFEAVRLALLERNEPLPTQAEISREPEPVSRTQKMRRLAILFLLVGAGVYILLSLFNFIVVDVFWPASPLIEIMRHIRNALTLVCVFLTIVFFILPFMLKESQDTR